MSPVYAPLDASKLTVTLASALKEIPPLGPFGVAKTDHMLVMSHDPVTGWSAPEIKPYAPLELDPSSNCLQYCTNVFEGMKAFLDPQDRPTMFRPEANMARLVSSAARMGLPIFDADQLLILIKKLVTVESRWIPRGNGDSLYIRPTMIGTKPSIGVSASEHAMLYVIVTPAGPYFSTGGKGGVSLLAVDEHVRSWPGGTGAFKLGLNYSPGFVPQRLAADRGYNQVLWLLNDGQRKLVTEAGSMNFFAVFDDEDGGITVVTPPLNGTILPGITRDSALALLRAHAASPSAGLLALPASLPRLAIEERDLTTDELIAAARAGRLRETFGVGTAVLVVAVERIGISEGERDIGKVTDIAMSHGKGLGPVGDALYEKILAIKDGREQFENWTVLC
ncbi:unnamed protein product [Mycena citricolor]|uniref:Branched-chain-amino-acid aminotransferase n=1 Tax=Mycena citricolor TaxID=2018698 RepID=A0AAD2I0C9_9AGAR|nr:unnamed protein product [Mycena citricolor]